MFWCIKLKKFRSFRFFYFLFVIFVRNFLGRRGSKRIKKKNIEEAKGTENIDSAHIFTNLKELKEIIINFKKNMLKIFLTHDLTETVSKRE